MSTSITQDAFWTPCDRCGELHDAAHEDLTGGCYCPRCRAAIDAANANPQSIGEILDEIGRNRMRAVNALWGEK